ncbi:hypothetical protein F2Q69_00012960 [Brassica cretica]|uniref:RNase H type-1 domain-containing protein n=1 Tax=Brassica cretica TaxID=69181 RepID=A0A8S9R9N2_BRACR|nr:hypothetical protein F2Q69_00012960 [Brassica cretica]
MSQPYKCWLSLMVSFPHWKRLTPLPAVRSQELEHQLERYLSNSAIRAFLVSLQDNFVDVNVLMWMLAVPKPLSLQYTTFRSLEDWILDVDTLVVECFLATILLNCCSLDVFRFVSTMSNVSRVSVYSRKIFKPYCFTGDSTYLPCSSSDSSFTEASCQFIGRCLASVYRVHLAQSRDVVLDFASLFFQLSHARRVYTASSPLLMNIRSKFRQISFPTVKDTRSAPSSAQTRIRHAERIQQDNNLIICKTDAAWEAPIDGYLGQCYIGSSLMVEAIAMRSALCMVQILEFSEFKVFSDNSTLIRAIFGNLRRSRLVQPQLANKTISDSSRPDQHVGQLAFPISAIRQLATTSARVPISSSSQFISLVVHSTLLEVKARRVYTAVSPLLMNIRSKFRQIRPFPTVKVTRSAPSSSQIRIRHAPRFQQDSNLIICKADAAWEAPIHGSLGQSYIGSPLIAEAIAMRLAFCMVQILEFPKLKVFTDISTLFRAISGNLQSKDIIGIVKDIRSISSGFASIFSCFCTSANVSAKEALKAFLSLYLTSGVGPSFGSFSNSLF